MIDQAIRMSIIAQEVSSTKIFDTLAYRGKLVQLPVIRVGIYLPVYRVRNGRTGVEQNEYVRREKKPEKFFSNGEEDQSVQDAQHGILLKMSENQRGNIYDELKLVAQQTEPLLITSHGVVVNGNRRLAAMRDLFIKDSQGFPAFSHVDVMVLPDSAGPADLERIETRLQMAPETKLEYSWINRLLKIRYQLDDLKLPRSEIKDMHRFKKEDDINKELQKLNLVDEYLSYIGTSEDYSKVESSAQMFSELQDSCDGKPDADYARMLAFPLIAYGTALIADKTNSLSKQRVYDYREAFSSKSREKVLAMLAKEKGILLDSETSPAEQTEEDEDDLLSGFGQGKPERFAPLKPILQEFSSAKETALQIASIVESLQQEQKDSDIKNRALKYVIEAHSLLHDVDVSVSATEKLPQIMAQLESINKLVERLQSEVNKIFAA